MLVVVIFSGVTILPEAVRVTSPPVAALLVPLISLLVILPLLAVIRISPALFCDEELTPVKMLLRTGTNSSGISTILSILDGRFAPKAVSILPLSLVIDIVPPSPATKEPE